uniref:Uncharacterized protein n=1 Tax=Vitis vinifera TaxID=29760 RepID=F6I0E9_VITVI
MNNTNQTVTNFINIIKYQMDLIVRIPQIDFYVMPINVEQ